MLAFPTGTSASAVPAITKVCCVSCGNHGRLLHGVAATDLLDESLQSPTGCPPRSELAHHHL